MRSLVDMTDFQLRNATESDRTYIARLNFLADVFGDESKPMEQESLDYYPYYVESWKPEHGAIIAWDRINPAGGVWLRWGTAESHGYGHVEEGIPELAIAVEQRYKGQGVGTQLLNAATELAREMGAPGISLSVAYDNPRAARLYRHVGFVDVDEHSDHYILVKRF